MPFSKERSIIVFLFTALLFFVGTTAVVNAAQFGCVSKRTGECRNTNADSYTEAQIQCLGRDVLRQPCPPLQLGQFACVTQVNTTKQCRDITAGSFSAAASSCEGEAQYVSCVIYNLLPDWRQPTESDCVTEGTCSGSYEYTYFIKDSLNNDCICQSFREGSLSRAQDYVEQLNPRPRPCGEDLPEDSTPFDFPGLLQLSTASCPDVNTSGLNTYHCIVLHSSKVGVNPGDCQEFQSANDVDAQDPARNLCAIDTAEAEAVRALPGQCPPTQSAGGSGIGSSGKTAADLLREASQTLNPGHLNAPTDVIRKAINILMAFIGSITLVLYIVAGLLWMTAGGASERVDKAKQILVWTTLGVMVMLFSYLLVSFLFYLVLFPNK